MALSYYHLNEFLKKNPQYGATPEQALKAAAGDMNTFGNNRVQLDGSVATWDQGGTGSRALNLFPGANAGSKIHDIVTDVFTSSFSNAVTILPSMALTYMALLPAPLVVELSVKQK